MTDQELERFLARFVGKRPARFHPLRNANHALQIMEAVREDGGRVNIKAYDDGNYEVALEIPDDPTITDTAFRFGYGCGKGDFCRAVCEAAYALLEDAGVTPSRGDAEYQRQVAYDYAEHTDVRP